LQSEFPQNFHFNISNFRGKSALKMRAKIVIILIASK